MVLLSQSYGFPAGINYRPFIRRPFQMQVWIQRTKQRCLREVNDLKEDDRNAFPLCTQAPDSVTVSVKMCKMRRWNIHRFVDAPQSRAVAKRIQSVPMCKKKGEKSLSRSLFDLRFAVMTTAVAISR